MHPRATLVAVITLLIVQGGVADDRIWRPYIELEGRGTSIRQLGQGNLFLPLAQDSDSMLFADFRGLWADNNTAESNWGLGYRKILSSDWILGMYGFFDVRDSEFNNTFHQGTVGAELLNEQWSFRGNGYLPEQSVKNAAGATAAIQQGGGIFVRPGQEAAYWGIDFEVERLLWYRNGTCCERRERCGNCGELDQSDSASMSWLQSLDAEVWAAGGAFYFDHDANGFESIAGPRVRMELRLYDLPLLGDESRLVVSGQYAYDDLRGSVGGGTLSVRIPFGPGGPIRGRLTGLDRRMVAPIVRDIDVVTQAGDFGAPEAAKIASSGRVVSQVIVIDATTAVPDAVIAGAGGDSVVIVDGSEGTIHPGGTISMDGGQILLGGGSGLNVIGSSTGAAAVFNCPGTRPTIHNANGAIDTIVVATDASVQGLNVVGGRNGIATSSDGNDPLTAGSRIVNNSVTGATDGFRFGDLDGVVSQNSADGNSGNGFIFDDVGFGGRLTDNSANNNGTDGFDFYDVQAGGQANGNTANGNDGIGFCFVDTHGTFDNNTANDNGDEGFSMSDVMADGQANGNTANNNGDSGFDLGDVAGTFNNNAASGNGDDGVAFGDVYPGGEARGNTAIDNGGYGFSFGDLGGRFNNNIANGNSDGGFDFYDVYAGAEASGNTANNNGDTGFYFGDIQGRFNNNTANGNAAEGFVFDDVYAGAEANGNSASNSGDIGFCFRDIEGQFNDNTANGSGGNGFDFIDVYAGGEANGNTANGNNGYGFSFRDIEGEFNSNTANNNSDSGVYFDEVYSGGQANGNTANGNGTSGFEFEVNDAGGSFSHNTANANGNRGFDVTDPNAGIAVQNSGDDNSNGGNAYP